MEKTDQSSENTATPVSSQVVPSPAPTAPTAPANVMELPRTGESDQSYLLGGILLALSGAMLLIASKLKRR